MTWSNLLSTGRGEVEFRLVIEGLEYEFVSHTSMETAPSGSAAGRVAGLSRDGITIEEQCDPGRAEMELGGMTLRILDETRDFIVTNTLAWHATRRTFLAADLGVADTTATVANAGAIEAGSVIHLGTEAIEVGGVSGTTLTGLTRARRGTVAQAHYANVDGLHPPQIVYIDRPAGIEGRRALLYAYGRGESPAVDDTPIWRGICQTDARLDDTGAFWELTIGGIDVLHQQDLGGDLELELRPRGVYYPWTAPLFFVLSSNSVGAEYTAITGFFETNEELVTHINSTLSTSSFTGLTITAIVDGEGWGYDVIRTAAALSDSTRVWTRSIFGEVMFGHNLSDPTDQDFAYQDTSSLTADATYRYVGGLAAPRGAYQLLDTSTNSFAVPFGEPGYGRGALMLPVPLTAIPQKTEDNDERRIHFDRAINVTQTYDAFEVEWTDDREPETASLKVGETSSDGNVILNVMPRVMHTWTADSLPTFRLKRQFASGGLQDLRSGIITNGPTYANLGSMPLITASDWGDWSAVSAAEGATVMASARDYVAFEAVKLSDLLTMEFRLRAVFPHLDADGKITLSRLRMPTATDAIVASIDESYQIHPARASFELNALGSINMVTLKTGYDPVEDEHTGDVFVARDIEAYARTKAPRELEIAPISTLDRGRYDLELIPQKELLALMQPIFGVYGRPYAVIDVEVDMRLFGVLVGNAVAVSASHFPNMTSGGRGGSFRGMVIGRSWEIVEGRGRLRILVLLQATYGWAPVVTITAESGGVLTVSQNDPLGIASMWQSGDPLSFHFEAGDKVRAREWNDASPTIVTGTVNDVDDGASEITVDWDSTFTFGSSSWVLEFAPAPDVVSRQNVYTFLGDTDGTVGFSSGDALRAWSS